MDFTQMPVSQGYKYLLVMTDTFTGWIEGFPTQTEKAEEVVKKLLHILKVRLLKLRARAFKKIIWGGSKRRDSFFCLETSNGSWLTPYMPLLI